MSNVFNLAAAREMKKHGHGHVSAQKLAEMAKKTGRTVYILPLGCEMMVHPDGLHYVMFPDGEKTTRVEHISTAAILGHHHENLEGKGQDKRVVWQD